MPYQHWGIAHDPALLRPHLPTRPRPARQDRPPALPPGVRNSAWADPEKHTLDRLGHHYNLHPAIPWSLDMKTTFILLAQYEIAVIPVEVVCRDYFQHLTPANFARKSLTGDIPIPVIQIEDSQKATRGVHVADLAKWIDDRRAAAVKEIAKVLG